MITSPISKPDDAAECRGPQGDAVLIRTDGPAVDSRQFPLHQGRAGIGLEREFLVKRNVMIGRFGQLSVEVRPYPDRGLFLAGAWHLLTSTDLSDRETSTSRRSRATKDEFAFIVRRSKLRGGTDQRRADCGEIANHWRRHEAIRRLWAKAL